MDRLIADTTLIVVVDVQERLAAAMPRERMADIERSAMVLLEAARLLGAKVAVTEQYPKGLGPTIAPIREKIAAMGAPVFEKMSFSAADDELFMAELGRCNPSSIIVLGMETHVCVFQTVRDLVKKGFAVHVPVDGVASRRDDHREVGLSLSTRAGASTTTTESIVFDWLKRAGTDEFRAISKLIR